MLGARGVCRLCQKQATYVREPSRPFDPNRANKHGQQLFLADMFTPHKTPTRRLGQAVENVPATNARRSRPAELRWLALRDQQLTLFTMKPDLAAGGSAGLHQRAHPDDVVPLEAVAHDFAQTYRWSTKQCNAAIIGVRIMLGSKTTAAHPSARARSKHCATLTCRSGRSSKSWTRQAR
jgi:hypothetical protein